MVFSYEMACLLDSYLKSINKDRYKTVMSKDFRIFTIPELLSIEELTINDMHNIDELSLLPNLKKLVITSEDYDKMVSDESLENNVFINHINDFSIISKLKKLESLTICNDINLKKLDITELKNLKELQLIDNPSFTTLIGLDKLKGLEKVLIYGNKLEQNINISDYINNTISTSPNILDIKMYNKIVNGNVNVARALSDQFILGLTFLKFAEKNGFVNLTILDNRNLGEMYSKLNTFFERKDIYSKTDEEKIFFVYSYIIRNIKFAEAQLRERMNKYMEIASNNKQIPKYLEKNFAALHSSYNAYHFKVANCEGIVNLMAFMFDMLNIENVNVHCRDKRTEYFNGTNHALLRVKLNDEWLYCDPTFNMNKPWEYYLVTMNDLNDTHEFSNYEKEIVGVGRYGKNNTEYIKRKEKPTR